MSVSASLFAQAPLEVSGSWATAPQSVALPDAGGIVEGDLGDCGPIRRSDAALRFGRWPAVSDWDVADEIDWSAVEAGTAGEPGSEGVPGMVMPDPSPSTGLGGRQRRHVLDPNTEFGPRLRRVSHWNLASNHGPPGRWVVWEERFFDARDVGWGPENGFDQSRAFVGWAWLTGPSGEAGAVGQGRLDGPPRLPGLGRPTRVEFGYLNQMIDRPGRDADQRLHFFSFNLFF